MCWSARGARPTLARRTLQTNRCHKCTTAAVAAVVAAGGGSSKGEGSNSKKHAREEQEHLEVEKVDCGSEARCARVGTEQIKFWKSDLACTTAGAN